MGSITRYTVHNPNNTIVKILFECEGDYGDVEDGVELEFKYYKILDERYNLKDKAYFIYLKLNDLKKDIELINAITQK